MFPLIICRACECPSNLTNITDMIVDSQAIVEKYIACANVTVSFQIVYVYKL